MNTWKCSFVLTSCILVYDPPAPAMPIANMALWATSGSLSWENLLRVSRICSLGLDTEIRPRASGTARLMAASPYRNCKNHNEYKNHKTNTCICNANLNYPTNNSNLEILPDVQTSCKTFQLQPLLPLRSVRFLIRQCLQRTIINIWLQLFCSLRFVLGLT